MFLAIPILPQPVLGGADEGGVVQTLKTLITPTQQRKLFTRITDSPAFRHKENGSIWEPGTSQHGGSTWKRWDNEKDWEKHRKPQSVMPNGEIRKDFGE